MGLVIAVAILAVLTAAGVTVYIKVRRLSESLLGTPDVTEGINRIRENVSTTPKSVSGMTRLMEPQIKRDFPEFVWEQFKRMSERVLVSALCAITTEDIYKLDREASDEVRQQVLVRIDSNEAAGFTEHFDEIRVHQTEISNYVKRDGRCDISIVAGSVGSAKYRKQEGASSVYRVRLSIFTTRLPQESLSVAIKSIKSRPDTIWSLYTYRI